MPLIPKPNYNQIFASQAPEQDKPAVFNNYPSGWGTESRPNNGKPTIKGFNHLQQTSDLKDLWILQNGACLPYDESIEYAEGAPVLKDGVIQYKTADGFKSRDAVTIPTYNNAADGIDPITGVADGAYFNVRSSNDESYIDEYQNVGGVPTPSGKRYLSALGVQLQEKPASTIKDASGKDQQEINDRTLYFSDFITVMNGSTDNTAAFKNALQQANGRQIIINKNEVIRLTSPIDMINIPINIFGLGGEIRIDHNDYGIKTAGNMNLDGEFVVNGMDKAHRALDVVGTVGTFLKITDNVHFKNFFGVDHCHVVRSLAAYNHIKCSFNKIRCHEPAAGAAENLGILRAVYLGGPRSYSIFDNIRVTDCNNVDPITGAITCYGADAIQCQNGVHFIEFIGGEFNDVGKRWLKLQGLAGSKAVVHSMTGSSSFVGTGGDVTDVDNGMYSCISIYGGDLEVKSLTLRGGTCMSAVTAGWAATGRVVINGLNYTPEYKPYVVGLVSRVLLIETDAANIDVEYGSGFSKGTYWGVDHLANNAPRLSIHDVKMMTYSTCIQQRAAEFRLKDCNLVSQEGGSFGLQVNDYTKVLYVKNINIEGAFQDGLFITSGRTNELLGSVSGIVAHNVTRNVITNYSQDKTIRLAIGSNFGPGTTNTQQIATRHNFRNKEGVDQLIISDSGVAFKTLQASAENLGNPAHSINVNKFTFQCVYNTTSKKLMVAQADGTWVSVDGVDTITPA